MKLNQSSLGFALEILNGKRIQFAQIKANEFPKDGTILFQSKDLTLAKKNNELFISATYTGQIKNSQFFITGIQAFRKLDAPAFGKTEIKNFPTYVAKNPIPVEKILANQNNGEIKIDKEQDPASYLTQLHQQLHKTPPVWGEIFPTDFGWGIEVTVSWGEFIGEGKNQKDARKDAARYAIDAHEGKEVPLAEIESAPRQRSEDNKTYKAPKGHTYANGKLYDNTDMSLEALEARGER